MLRPTTFRLENGLVGLNHSESDGYYFPTLRIVESKCLIGEAVSAKPHATTNNFLAGERFGRAYITAKRCTQCQTAYERTHAGPESHTL